MTSFMITTAVPSGEDAPTIFVLDVRNRPFDGSAGLRLVAEWDGVGMAATQSHAMRLDECPAIRMAWDGPVTDIMAAASPIVLSVFTAVVLGVFDEAIRTAKTQLAKKAEVLRPYERVEWSAAEMEHWLAVQAYEGALRAIECGDAGPGGARRAARQGGRRRARRALAASAHPRHRRIDVLPALAVRVVVRGRPRPRLPAAPVGARPRHAVHHVLPLTTRGLGHRVPRRRHH